MLITEIILQANHLASLKNFYKEVMDLPVLFSDQKTLRVLSGNSVLSFEKNEEMKEPYYN